MDDIKRVYLANRKIEISKGRTLGLSVYHDEDWWGFHVEIPLLVNLFVPLVRSRVEPEEMWESYGFSWMENTVHLNWGGRCKIIHMPWDHDWVRTSYLLVGGSLWQHYYDNSYIHAGTKSLQKWTRDYSYTYVLKNGTVQNRTATVTVEEREWRWRWFKWLPLTKTVRRCISVEFDQEVGERTGSWKGGTIGCGYDLLPDELPEDCLRRMERERIFD